MKVSIVRWLGWCGLVCMVSNVWGMRDREEESTYYVPNTWNYRGSGLKAPLRPYSAPQQGCYELPSNMPPRCINEMTRDCNAFAKGGLLSISLNEAITVFHVQKSRKIGERAILKILENSHHPHWKNAVDYAMSSKSASIQKKAYQQAKLMLNQNNTDFNHLPLQFLATYYKFFTKEKYRGVSFLAAFYLYKNNPQLLKQSLWVDILGPLSEVPLDIRGTQAIQSMIQGKKLDAQLEHTLAVYFKNRHVNKLQKGFWDPVLGALNHSVIGKNLFFEPEEHAYESIESIIYTQDYQDPSDAVGVSGSRIPMQSGPNYGTYHAPIVTNSGEDSGYFSPGSTGPSQNSSLQNE